MIEKGRDRDRRDQGQPELRASPEKVKNEVMKINGASHPEKFEARAPDRHYRNYILFLFIRIAHKSTFVCFLFLFLSDSKIVTPSPVFCKWQNRFWDSEPVVACFSSNKSGTSNIRIPHSSSKLHPTPCMRDVCRVTKQNIFSLILLILLAKLTNKKRGICKHCILHPL